MVVLREAAQTKLPMYVCVYVVRPKNPSDTQLHRPSDTPKGLQILDEAVQILGKACICILGKVFQTLGKTFR